MEGLPRKINAPFVCLRLITFTFVSLTVKGKMTILTYEASEQACAERRTTQIDSGDVEP